MSAALHSYLAGLAAVTAAARRERQPIDRYTSLADYILDRGTYEVSRPLSDEQREYLKSILANCTAKYRECFYNAQVLADRHPRLTYREGYAVGLGGFPVHHGWCLLDGTHLIDTTWRQGRGRAARRVRGVIPTGWAYLGITPQRTEKHLLRAVRLGAFFSYLDSPDEGWPLLQQPRQREPEWLDLMRLHTGT